MDKMSWALFIDESGTDCRSSPYEVLAGIAIEDKHIWRLICALAALQDDLFGMRLFDAYDKEAKATELLKRTVFTYAAKNSITTEERKTLTYELLRQQKLTKIHNAKLKKENARRQYEGLPPQPLEQFNIKGKPFLAALAQTKLLYCENALEIVRQYGGIAFATIISQEVQRPLNKELLRKDYNFLFERFYYHLDHKNRTMGYVICDELEKTKSHLLLTQIKKYFLKTQKGQKRSELIIPETLFVHSDLTTLIQMADLIAYIISWGYRRNQKLTAKHRPELDSLVDQVCALQFKRDKGRGKYDWGFKVITNLG